MLEILTFSKVPRGDMPFTACYGSINNRSVVDAFDKGGLINPNTHSRAVKLFKLQVTEFF